MPENRKLIKMTDLLIILLILVVATVFFILPKSSEATICEIVIDGIATEIDLSKDRIFTLPQKQAVEFEVRNKGIAFITSDCPDKVCIHSGFLRQSGEMAACLPNKIVLKLYSKETTPDSPDMIAN